MLKTLTSGDSEKISDAHRHVIYIALGVCCALGMFTFLFLVPPPAQVTFITFCVQCDIVFMISSKLFGDHCVF